MHGPKKQRLCAFSLVKLFSECTDVSAFRQYTRDIKEINNRMVVEEQYWLNCRKRFHKLLTADV
jgi:hypothetical protein